MFDAFYCIKTWTCYLFQALRDPDGNQYSPYEYSLQQSADGTVVLVPRASGNLLDDTRSKHKDPEPKEWQACNTLEFPSAFLALNGFSKFGLQPP